MPFDHDQIDNLDTVIDGLDAPTTLETWDATDAYDAGMVAASAVRRALAGGGGGSLPAWWDIDDVNAIVTMAGRLVLGGGDPVDDDTNVLVLNQIGGSGDKALLRASDADGDDVLFIGNDDVSGSFRVYYRTGEYVVQFGNDAAMSVAGLAGRSVAIADLWAGKTFDAYTTDPFPSDAVLAFIATLAGTSGATIELVSPSPTPDQPLALTGNPTNVQVQLATDGGGDVSSLASEIADLINGSDGLNMTAESLVDGLVAALGEQNLSGGLQQQKAWGVLGNGAEYKISIAAPSDDSVASSQVAEWFDDTSGAPAPRFKAKDVDGTLYVGQLVTLLADGTIKIPNLPTSDPSVADQLWNSAGTLKVSAG